ncbi:MAG: hypothetical protein KIT61_09055 [Pyrinomonadaceae bacterium]|nr:hypothetical protein [Blastocatellia bacterium]MCW5956722.1 hypothetical protein [Pyrinomonadaceae bacterium]
MEAFSSLRQCPRCNAMKMADYEELNDDQHFLIDRLPDFEDLSGSEIRRSRFCTKCWFRESLQIEQTA